jgi:hypothetical protein
MPTENVKRLPRRDAYFDASADGRELEVELFYPRELGEPSFVRVSLCCIRAADDLRISYDFDRDGWTIEKQDEEGAWKEAAFIP